MSVQKSMEQMNMIPAEAKQTFLLAGHSEVDPDYDTHNVFRNDVDDSKQRELIRKHRAWLDTFRHEYPLPLHHYRIGVYIRYFNQTKYEDYLNYHKKVFHDTIADCKNWELVDFYVDKGISAPRMENAKEWCRLLNDCLEGKVDLIITQKLSNVSRRASEIAFVARMLAAQRHPVGIYFISENLFTLASYYQSDLHETGFLPENWTPLPDDELDNSLLLDGGEQDGTTDE